MKVCLIGNNLTSLILAKTLCKKNFHTDIYSSRTPVSNFNTRTIGISEYNLNFLNNHFKNISKITHKINQIEVRIKNKKNTEKIIFDQKSLPLFNMVEYNKFLSYVQSKTKKEKNISFKKFKNKNNILSLVNKNKYDLIINCDSSNLLTKKYLKIKIFKNYFNKAFTTILRHKKIKNNKATQIFTQYGPIAFLPLNNFLTSIVFSIEIINNKKFTDDKIFKLINEFNPLYKILSYRKIENFDLKLRLPKKYFHKNILFFGDAIHSVHPLAGQGFNMTIRDIIKFNQILEKKLNLGLGIDHKIYSEFEKNIKSFNSVFSFGIDFIHELFKFNKNYLPEKISKTIFNFINKNKKIKDFGIKFANKGSLITE